MKQVHEVFLRRTSGPERTVTLQGLTDAVVALVENATIGSVYEAVRVLIAEGRIIAEEGWGPDTQLFRRDEFV